MEITLTDKKSIMIVEDEMEMRKMIRSFLEEDYHVLEASDGLDALIKLDKHKVHLLLIDVMMPMIDGFTLAEEVKHLSDIPLIFLTAKGEQWDKVHGLKLGGDDYIVKPFMPQELLARIESVLRRCYSQTINHTLIAGPLSIDADSYTVTLDHEPLTLTRKEFHLLYTLAENKGRVYSREQLLHLVWGDQPRSTERTIDTHIKTLRLKLKKYGDLIQTVWGVGYKFVSDNEASNL